MESVTKNLVVAAAVAAATTLPGCGSPIDAQGADSRVVGHCQLMALQEGPIREGQRYSQAIYNACIAANGTLPKNPSSTSPATPKPAEQ